MASPTVSHSVPKAVLYYSPSSVWSKAALLALKEKGYGNDELDLRVVDTTKGEEFSPTFLRLNPKATVPILVVPLRGTLNPDVETRFKVIADPKALVDFLDKSRSPTSNTTSTAPAPSLSPATINFATISGKIIETVYAEAISPKVLHHFNARDPRSQQALAAILVPILDSRRKTVAMYLAECEREIIRMSEKTKAFWNNRKQEIETLVEQLSTSEGEHAERYFAIAKQTWEHAVPDALAQVDREIVGPYTLGDQFSIADIHLSVWLAHVVKLSGGSFGDSGDVAMTKVEQHTGFTLPKDSLLVSNSLDPRGGERVPTSKLAVFWDAMQGRSSWENTFA